MKQMCMSFGELVWDYNPENITISSAVGTAELKGFSGNDSIQSLSHRPRVIRGKGSFTGQDAEKKYQELEKLFDTGEGHILSLPGRKPVFALPITLKLLRTPGSGFIEYEFEFRECPEQLVSKSRVFIADEGESLLDYAYAFGISIEKLAQCNRHIEYIDYLDDGERVNVPW